VQPRWSSASALLARAARLCHLVDAVALIYEDGALSAAHAFTSGEGEISIRFAVFGLLILTVCC